MQKEGCRSSADVRYLMLSGIPLLCLWTGDGRRIGSICSHGLGFPAGFLCREILLRSICPLLLFHKVLNGSAHKDRLGGNILQESALLQLVSVQPRFSQNAEKNESAAHTGLQLKPFEGLQTVAVLLGFHCGSSFWVLECFTPDLLRTLLQGSVRH